MKVGIVSWNGTNINNGSPLKAYVPEGQLSQLNVSPVLVTRADDYPALTNGVKQGSAITIGVYSAAGQDINTARELVKKIFFGDSNMHALVVQDEADGNKQYYRNGIAVMLAQENASTPNSWYVRIQTEYPYWQLVTPATDTWSITASGQTHDITNSGNLLVKPVYTITPTTTKAGGFLYRRYVPVYNNTDETYVSPLEITNGGLDTAALVTGGKMQADGDDLRIWMDGIEVDRWLSGMNTATTKIWVNVNLLPRLEGTTGASMTNVATTMTFSQTRANMDFLKRLKGSTNTTILIESEAIVFDPDNVDLINYQITSLVRAQKGTSAASHTSGLTVRYIEHDLWILYGDSTLTVPDVNDDNKPMFDLTSTNGTWSWTNYFDSTAKRPGSWKGEVKASRTKLSYVYTGNENTFADPSTKLGLAERAAQDFTVPHETALLYWLLSHPAGITSVTYSGKKYNTGSWPGIVGFQKLQAGTVWMTVENLAAPVAPLGWVTFGPTTQSLSSAYPSVRFVIDGTLSSVVNETALVQFDTVSVTFYTNSLPTISVGAEATINFFDFKLTNNTTGEWLRVKTPCPINTALTLDTVTKTAYLADGRIVPVFLSSDRSDWLNLSSSSNTLRFDDTGTVAVTFATSHRDRIL